MSLRKQVLAYKMLELPGQPISVHMGTSYLINDLWNEIERLNDVINEKTWRYENVKFLRTPETMPNLPDYALRQTSENKG